MTEKPTALIAMSGGVDSSVAAALMVQRGYDCIGVTMKLRSSSDCACTEKSCCTADDAEDARNAAYSMGMKFYVFNFVDEFERDVIGRFISAYENGQTPNPCIDCNRYMKFELLYQRGRALGCEYIVTGHYARTEFLPEYGRWVLKKARNLAKDQSYVLYSMTQEQLSHTIYPLGEFESKDEVRALADKLGLMNAHKHDSQDICFIPDGDYASFIEENSASVPPCGNYISEDGCVLGRHRGHHRTTLGQGKGLGIALGRRVYVINKNASDNTVTLGSEERLYKKRVTADSINIICPGALEKRERFSAKIRYGRRENTGYAERTGEDTLTFEFDEAVRAPSPGQSLVIYDGVCVVAGGIIRRAD